VAKNVAAWPILLCLPRAPMVGGAQYIRHGPHYVAERLAAYEYGELDTVQRSLRLLNGEGDVGLAL
jgi:hypothetical protein